MAASWGIDGHAKKGENVFNQKSVNLAGGEKILEIFL